MKTGKKVKAAIIALALIACMAGGVFAGGGQQSGGSAAKVFRVGYANDNDADFFRKLVRDTFEDMIKGDAGFSVTYTNAAGDLQTQLDHIDNFIAQGMNAIIVQPADTAGIVPGIEKANKAGIPIISIISRSGGGNSIYIGNTYLDGGIMQAEYMIKALPQNAKIVYMQGQPGFDHSRDRRAGFLDTLKKSRPDVTVLADQTANYDRAEGMKLMEDWIQAYPQIDGVICGNDQMALGALQALRMAGRDKGVLVCGVDATDEACQEIKAGGMAMTVLQSAPLEAQGCYDTLKKLKAGETVPRDVIIPQIPVTRDNVDEYLK
ncbi:MAG: sugar ABC transporter substrate-binding protein [Treponema sp.]|jgi:inositol transport system substrate-binding protein|nr:sugar ABC transporter substrate-binding protein [Treponema sp.]